MIYIVYGEYGDVYYSKIPKEKLKIAKNILKQSTYYYLVHSEVKPDLDLDPFNMVIKELSIARVEQQDWDKVWEDDKKRVRTINLSAGSMTLLSYTKKDFIKEMTSTANQINMTAKKNKKLIKEWNE